MFLRIFYDLTVFVCLVCSQRSYDPMPTYPQKENWEIRASLFLLNLWEEDLCILFKAQDDEAKSLTVFDCVRICHL